MRSLLPGLICSFFSVAIAAQPPNKPYFEILVLDEQTQRGVPLVELATVDHRRYHTDNAGRVAFHEPELMGQETFFHVRSHGYEYPKDGFGFAGVRLTPRGGEKATIQVKRQNVAERLYRITGIGQYRDTVLLGYEPPVPQRPIHAGVVGQDSTQAALYRGRIHWFWGDTSLARYPLGVFRSTGATSLLPQNGGLDPSVAVNLDYFKDDKGHARGVCPLENEPGVVWLDGVVTVPDKLGQERLVAHYFRMKSLSEKLEHGMAVWNDDKQIFERVKRLELQETWRCLQGHPLRHRDGDVEYLYTGVLFPTARVPARLEDVLNPESYEALGVATNASVPGYVWHKEGKPVTIDDEQRRVKEGKLSSENAHFLPRDVESRKPIRLHAGSIRWNSYRQRWILVAVEQYGTSFLGELWYGEAESPAGPWRRVRKIVTHDKYSFYNPVHHPFFDQREGRVIYFEGTYTREFSGNPVATPGYDYNQILYRLDLDDPRLARVRGE